MLINPLDHHAIAKAIEYLLKNPVTAKEMGTRGARAVKHQYNWDTEQAKLWDMYRDLIGEPRAALAGRTNANESPVAG